MNDTVKLLKECNLGIKTGVRSIDSVLSSAKDARLRECLAESKQRHEKTGNEIDLILCDCGAGAKEPPVMLKMSAWLATKVRLAFNKSDKTVAMIITRGCNTGINHLTKYLNEYKEADEKSRAYAKKLIRIEEELVESIKKFL